MESPKVIYTPVPKIPKVVLWGWGRFILGVLVELIVRVESDSRFGARAEPHEFLKSGVILFFFFIPPPPFSLPLSFRWLYFRVLYFISLSSILFNSILYSFVLSYLP